MVVRKIKTSDGGYIKFENDEEYREYRKRQTIKTIIGVSVFLLFGIIGTIKQRSHKVESNAETTEEMAVTQSSYAESSFEQHVSLSDLEIMDEGTEDLTMTQNSPIEEDVLIPEKEEEIVEDDLVPKIEEEDFSKQKICDIVEEMPSYPDGDVKLMEYIAQNINYPQEALESGIQGRVFVSFVVEPNGSITNEKVLRGIGYGCDEEALRVVKEMPKWTPGKRKGKPVRVAVTIPVKFMFQ